jgi:predicted metalloprotease with PDZ domain
MHLARALDPSQYALVSSIGPDAGVFMIGDLLPRICFGDENCAAAQNVVRLMIEPPTDWRIATTESRQGESRQGELFHLTDPSRAIFFLGRLREGKAKIGELNLRVAIAGDWFFREQEVFSLAEAVAREQAVLVGGSERGEFLVTLAPFPQPMTGLRSSAVTIGHTVVLLLNPDNDATQSFKHYRRHLAHEMFHFYLPNAFRVRENFDWFWEGFTRYVALMTLARLRQIDLREYLDAIHAEYEAYIFNSSRAQISLIAASPEKFANAASYDLIYRKGMLVAALYDLELRWQSHGNSSLADVMKALYRNYSLTGHEIGNQEVLQEMKSPGDFARLIHGDIVGIQQINLAERVKIYGLMIEQNIDAPGRLQLKPAAKLSSRQQALISKLANEKH